MIYFIEAVGAGLLKIGFTDRDPEQRLKELQTGCPHELRLAGVHGGNQQDERRAHAVWSHLRTAGEWFRIDDRLRGFLWWLEFGRPAADLAIQEVDRVADRLDALGSDTLRLAQSVAAVEEAEGWSSDQIRRLWGLVERMHGWCGQHEPVYSVAAHDEAIAELQRSVAELRSVVTLDGPISGRSRFADCRM